ncbi:hypothetical protein M409DRAFT_28475 [Zasmidium cellare ATCC 36951]|uniref:Uncharacterized protein n=1 Tax=Zasmidium cellare ATCC 36951 TaxID=1080233 RepID=A0A6A6C6X7_ZASCE|nr:uncharacterized protein M409DRAFT_28475 [Zasmidium cellare ATCC 36951]KAF2161146.1 hypothetical protein M409DRAFT_28475 [Zasmidium cellare ATCC 36951]
MFPIDRAMSPFQSSLVARRPWPAHPLHAGGPNLVSVQERALHSLLPDIARQLLHYSYDAGALIDQLILESPELPPITQWNPLEEHELRRAYVWVIEAISRASYGEVELNVVDGLMEALESRLAEDANATRMMDQPYFHQRSQHLFRSMAEVSRQAKSLKLGNVLASFFISHASQIASIEHSLALGQWCYSILRVTMRQTDRIECLRRVLLERPDLPAKLIGRGRKAAEVAENLELIGGGQIGRRELHVREGLAVNDPMMGLRHRSRSRGRRDIFGVDDFGLRGEGDELARQAERLMLAQEDAAHESRRMVQLSLGRRYGDLLGRVEPLGMGRVGVRGGLGGLGGMGGLDGLGRLDGMGGLGGLRGLGAASPFALEDRRLRLEDELMDEI